MYDVPGDICSRTFNSVAGRVLVARHPQLRTGQTLNELECFITLFRRASDSSRLTRDRVDHSLPLSPMNPHVNLDYEPEVTSVCTSTRMMGI